MGRPSRKAGAFLLVWGQLALGWSSLSPPAGSLAALSVGGFKWAVERNETVSVCRLELQRRPLSSPLTRRLPATGRPRAGGYTSRARRERRDGDLAPFPSSLQARLLKTAPKLPPPGNLSGLPLPRSGPGSPHTRPLCPEAEALGPARASVLACPASAGPDIPAWPLSGSAHGGESRHVYPIV